MMTAEEIMPLLDQLSEEDKIALVNKFRNDFGLPSRSVDQFRAQGAAFTAEEEEIIDRLIAAGK